MASSDASPDRVVDALRALDHDGARGGVTTPLEMQGTRPRISMRDHEKYVSVTMEFRCNLACTHCMIEGTMDHLKPTSDAAFQKVLDEQSREGRWEGLVLTGSEITLNRDLPNLARRAREAGFSHVRIQTHGVHLARPDYAARLVDAGVDEYFVSVAGATRERHDEITKVAGAWDKMLAGMEILDQYDHVKLLTNTVVTRESYRDLPGIVTALAHLRQLVQMEFWTYWPMAETDVKQLCVAHEDILPYLREAIVTARGLDRFVEVKNFPECLLGNLGDALVNAQPLLLIDPAFWEEFDRNGFHQCKHRDRCASTECLGLNSAYIERFGWEEGLLSPIPKQDGR